MKSYPSQTLQQKLNIYYQYANQLVEKIGEFNSTYIGKESKLQSELERPTKTKINFDPLLPKKEAILTIKSREPTSKTKE